MRQKLLLLLIFPILGMLSFSLFLVKDKTDISKRMGNLEEFTKIAVQAVDMVHEIQKERGLSLGFVGSGGKQFGGRLLEQRLLTDQHIAIFRRTLSQFDRQGIDISDFGDHKTEIKHNLGKIGTVRTNISGLQVTPFAALEFYNSLNKSVFGMVGHITRMSPNLEISRLGSAFRNILESTERLGILRAVLNQILVENSIDRKNYRFIIALEAERQFFLQRFAAVSEQKLMALYRRQISSHIFQNIERVLDTVLHKDNLNPVVDVKMDASQWFGMGNKQWEHLQLQQRDL